MIRLLAFEPSLAELPVTQRFDLFGDAVVPGVVAVPVPTRLPLLVVGSDKQNPRLSTWH